MADELRMRASTLRTELRITLAEIEAQITVVRGMAKEADTESYLMRDERGFLLMVPLLSAKAQCLSALVDLQK